MPDTSLLLFMLAVPVAYEIVRYGGAAYLVYLGLRTLLNRREATAGAAIKPDSLRTIFLQGVLTNVLNPKVALFCHETNRYPG